MGKYKAIFYDRDGTLNHDYGYTYKIEDFRIIEGVIEALKILKNDFKFFIVTNQSGVGRGYFTLEDVYKFNKKMLEEFKIEGIKIEEVYICPHVPEDNCDCRKPSTKHIKQAEKEFDIDIKSSWVIGDHPYDIEMGIKAGCKAIYLLTGQGKKHIQDLESSYIKPNLIAENFLQAAEFIMGNFS